MTPFHIVSVLAVVGLVIMVTVGDDIAAFLQSLGCFLDPTERLLMRVAEEARTLSCKVE